ncbi:MAG: SGNH/GDSL hydrolase family protein [Clostridia bacterium]|nr:SGNH/GDSL hydrolase family protein [Clostridia bacterium]
MILTPKQLKSIIHGAYQFKDEDGYTVCCRVTDAQMEYYKSVEIFYVRAHHTGAVHADLRTNATEIGFDYKLDYIVSTGSIDVCVDGVPCHVFPMGDITEGHFSCKLPAGMKTVQIYFPNYCRLMLRNFTLNGSFTPTRRRTKVLWLGDSITQGAGSQNVGSMMSSGSYVNLTTRTLGYDSLDQAIGGLMYDDGYMLPLEGYTPNKIIVSLGTNGCGGADFADRAERFYAALNRLYSGIPTLVISPIWRADDACAFLPGNLEKVRQICAKYPNIAIVNGFTLMPNLPELLHEDKVHPNLLGHKYYADNLIRTIRGLHF